MLAKTMPTFLLQFMTMTKLKKFPKKLNNLQDSILSQEFENKASANSESKVKEKFIHSENQLL